MEQMKISKVWVDATHVYAETENGIRASYAFSDWPRLANATEAERQDFHLSYSGIHWPKIDEDLSFEGMFEDNWKIQSELTPRANVSLTPENFLILTP